MGRSGNVVTEVLSASNPSLCLHTDQDCTSVLAWIFPQKLLSRHHPFCLKATPLSANNHAPPLVDAHAWRMSGSDDVMLRMLPFYDIFMALNSSSDKRQATNPAFCNMSVLT